MGPRIILRGAIPIDSNIGGSGHRPLLREARARFVLCVCFLFGLFSVLGVGFSKVVVALALFFLTLVWALVAGRYNRGHGQFYRWYLVVLSQ